MTDNFLPEFKPPNLGDDTLRCKIRNKPVRYTPEEEVRQRVLRWLICDKGRSKECLDLERSYELVGDPGRTRIRSDIELSVNGKVTVVIVGLGVRSHNAHLRHTLRTLYPL